MMTLHMGFRLVSKLVTLNDVITADARYICGNWAFLKILTHLCEVDLHSTCH